MLPELGIERIFRREIDSLPLPPERAWIPDRQTARRSIPLTALVISATVVLVLGAVVTARDVGDAAATGRRGVTTAPLLNAPRPTCLRGGCNVYRSDAFGYGIVLPADWHVAPPLHGRTPLAGALDRVEFTNQKPDEWTMAFGADSTVGKMFPIPYLQGGTGPLDPESLLIDSSNVNLLNARQVPYDVEINRQRAHIIGQTSGFSTLLGSPYVFAAYSDAARYINGAIIPADAGWTAA